MSKSAAEDWLARQMDWAQIKYERQYRFHPTRQWRFDFMLIPELSCEIDLAVEVDGGTWIGGRHTRGTGFEADCEKLNEAAILGWRVLRITPSMIEDGRALRWIEQALGREPA